MVEVVLDEVTDEEVEEDMWRCLLCPWRRYWTVKEVTAGDVRPLAMFLNMTSSNIVIFLLHVLNFWHIIAMVTLPWFNYDLPFKLPWYEKKTEFWDPQLTAWLVQWHHEQCHDKPHVRLHDRRHEWPHWQYHDRPKLWYQGSFTLLVG